MIKNNVCKTCATKNNIPYPESLNSILLDTGTCHYCGKHCDVYDHELISFFKSKSFSDDDIYTKLFRLRTSWSQEELENRGRKLTDNGFCQEEEVRIKNNFSINLKKFEWNELIAWINKKS